MIDPPVALHTEPGVFVLSAGLLYVAGLLALFRWTDAHRAEGSHRSRGKALP